MDEFEKPRPATAAPRPSPLSVLSFWCPSCLQAGGATPVPGTSNPFLAGMPNGSACCSGDTAPAQSPVFAAFIATPGLSLTFSVTGSVDHTGATPTLSPDGSGLFSTPSNNGIAGRELADRCSRRGLSRQQPAGLVRGAVPSRLHDDQLHNAFARPETGLLHRGRPDGYGVRNRSDFHRSPRSDAVVPGDFRRLRVVQQFRQFPRERRSGRSRSDTDTNGASADADGSGSCGADSLVPDDRCCSESSWRAPRCC